MQPSSLQRKKISIIGAGNVGSAAALWIASKHLGNVVLVDIVPGLPQGKALDLQQALPMLGIDAKIIGSNEYTAIQDSDIVVVTAGKIRREGMTRADLLEENGKIVAGIIRHIVAQAPNSIIIVVTNPLDAMVYVAAGLSKFPKNRVMGMAGCLDTTRLKAAIAEETGASVNDITAMVIGAHNDMMVPLTRLATVAGRPLHDLLTQEKIEEIVKKATHGGKEFLTLMNTSAYVAPGMAIAEMVDAILNDKKRVLPVSAYLDGEYGQHGLCIGVPVALGKDGVERVIDVGLTAQEKIQFEKSCDDVRTLIQEWKKKQMILVE